MSDDLLERLKTRQKERGGQEEAISTIADPTADLNTRLREQQKLREQGVHAAAPQKIDKERREELLARSVGQEQLGKPGLRELGMRVDLGFSDTFEEKKAKFLSKYPEGEFEQVFDQPRLSEGQRNTTILFRRHPGEDFAELDRSMLEGGELLYDIADLSGEVPATVMELIYTRGQRLVTQVLRSAGATLAGDTFKESVEELRGFQRETVGQIAEREVGRVAFGAFGTAGTVAISGPLNMVRGAATIAVRPGTGAAIRATKRLGVPGLLPGQVARSPLIQKLQGQAAVVLKTVQDYINDQQSAIARGVGLLREGDMKKVLAGELESVHDAARNQIIKAATIVPSRSLTETGTALAHGIAQYDTLAKLLVQRSYQRARDIQEPVFDITKLQEVARSLKEGTIGVGRDGKPVQLSKIDPKLESVIDSILSLDPSLPVAVTKQGVEISAVDQLRALRSQLWDMKTPNPGEISRQPHADANKIYGALTKTMRDPKNTDPAFLNAWRDADTLASRRFTTMEQLMIIEASKTETPALLAGRLANPNQVDNLRILRNAMPDSKWGEFREGVRADFISPEKVDNLTKRLDTFDKPTLDMLMSPADQSALREVGKQIDNLNRADIKGVLERQNTYQGIVRELVNNGDSGRIKTLVGLADKNPALKNSLRAGLMEDVWNGAIETVKGVRTVNQKAINARLKQLRESGAIYLLSFSDIRTLRSASTLAELVPALADTGASLQAGEVVRGVRGAFRGAPGSAIHIIIEHASLGRVLISEKFQRLALGSGGVRSEFNSLRVLGSVLAREYQKLNAEAEQPVPASESP